MRGFLRRRGEGVAAPLELHLLSPGGLEGRFVRAEGVHISHLRESS